MAGQAKLKRMFKSKGARVMHNGESYPVNSVRKYRAAKKIMKRLSSSDDRRGIWRVAAPY